MFYPQYPTIESYHKYPTNEGIMQVYDMLTELGVYCVSRKRGTKIPLAKYWRKAGRIEANRDSVRDDLESGRSDALCVVTGEKSGRLIVLDFDSHELTQHGTNPILLYEHVQMISPNPFVLYTPAGGVHMYYRVPEDMPLPGNDSPVFKGMDLRGQGGQVVTIGGVNTYTVDADKKGVPVGHRGIYTRSGAGSYKEIPFMTVELYELLFPEKEEKHNPEKPRNKIEIERIASHSMQPVTERVAITLECLSYILSTWSSDKEYEQWYQMWMSAYHACDGDYTVRDYILNHSNVYWRDGEKGIQHFISAWDTYIAKDSGYTVASLFWLARRSGWLTTTGYEIPENRFQTIEVRYITEWLETLDSMPRRLLLKSQTGSGKTHAISYLYNKLDKPRTVIFVPSIKLATELAYTLQDKHNLPVTLYRDNVEAKTLSYTDLASAKILVTTLQTFVTKVASQGVPMRDYGLVYVEESDQLISQFARGGGGYHSSHVREREARGGFDVLRDAMLNSGYVWCVDATMSRVTYDFSEATRGDMQVTVVKNTQVTDKAPVKFIGSIQEAYSLVMAYLERGLRVVYVADTRKEIDTVMLFLDSMQIEANRIAITRSTERNANVIEFMTDVNRYAKDYQFVAYNSVMASGVSITDVEPDLVLQVCRYLTPRVNLQLLNRYRNQKRVYCLYPASERLYSKSQSEYAQDYEKRAQYEAELLSVPLATRTSNAELRNYLSSLSVADSDAQNRSPVTLYQSLLKEDGRRVFYDVPIEVMNTVSAMLELIRELQKEQQELVKNSWRSVPPIDSENPAKPDTSPVDIARGELHAHINRSLMGNIPDDEKDITIYKIVKDFHAGRHILTSIINPEDSMNHVIRNLADVHKAYSTLYSQAAILSLMDLTAIMFPDYTETISGDVVDYRAKEFMKAFADRRDIYDNVISRNNQKYSEILKKNEDITKRALALCKIILKLSGLKMLSSRVKRVKGVEVRGYCIENYEAAKAYVKWRSDGKMTLDINTALLYAIRDNSLLDAYNALTADSQRKVLDAVVMDRLTYTEAIDIVRSVPEW